jgi:hypothetical protein
MIKRLLILFCFLITSGVNVLANTPPSGKTLLTGVVLDATSNETLTGAMVKIPGTSIYTFTDAEGKFTLECAASETPQELVISLVSFSPAFVKVDNPSVLLQVQMHEK